MADHRNSGSGRLRRAQPSLIFALIPLGFYVGIHWQLHCTTRDRIRQGKAQRTEKPMLRIETIENASAITLELHGRLIGPWVPLLEDLWRSTEGCPAGKSIAVDLTDVTAVDGAGRYLLRLMEAKSVKLAGGGIGIRALLDNQGNR
jgi:hypothetical protein